MEPEDFSAVRNLIVFSRELTNKQKEKVNALVTNAINSTKTQISRYRENNHDESSRLISGIWLHAATELMKINNDVLKNYAETLRMKSVYWSNPHGFDPQKLSKYKMYLTDVEKELKRLMI